MEHDSNRTHMAAWVHRRGRADGVFKSLSRPSARLCHYLIGIAL